MYSPDSLGHLGSDSSVGADESVESPSQTQHDLPDDNPHIAAEPTVATLLDLAVKVTAKHISCEEIEHRQPLLDDRLLKKVAFWACPHDIEVVHAIADVTLREGNEWDQGRSHIKKDLVRDMVQVGFMVCSVVDNKNVYFTFEKQNITSTSCDSCQQRWCSHVFAAIIYRINNADLIPIHAPVMDSLASLNRDQLLKLLYYAINDDPGSLLGKVFGRIGQVQDPTSEINIIPGVPDPTFGLEHESQSSWDLTLEEIRSSFHADCNRTFSRNMLSCTNDTFLYNLYIQKVVNLCNMGEVEKAGQLLVTLVTEASNLIAGNDIQESKRYRDFMKMLEKVCCLYILQFTGKGRRELVQLCQNISRNLQTSSWRSIWTDLPSVTSLFPVELIGEPLDSRQQPQCLFYEPLSVHIAPEPPDEFYNILNGNTEAACSTYDESLALMLLRFEALRLWKKRGKEGPQALRIGAVIIRKLLHLTQKPDLPPENTHFMANKRRSVVEEKALDYRIPAKKRKTLCDVWAETDSETQDDTCVNASCDDSNDDTNRETLAELRTNDDSNAGTKKEILTEFQTMLKDIPGIARELDSDAASTDIWSIDQVEWLKSLDYLCMMMYSMGTYNYEIESVSKEQLTYCLMHICCTIYETKNFETHLTVTEKKLLAVATLRAVELTRFRVSTENKESINHEEISSWDTLTEKLIHLYEENIERLVSSDVSSSLETLYMKGLCKCNRDGKCFFENAIPLELIAFLVKRAFDDNSPRDDNVARSLCLYTLCHSNMPTRYYSNLNQGGNDKYTDTYNKLVKRFSDVSVMFLANIKCHLQSDVWLEKLLQKYETTQDGVALSVLWRELERLFPEDHFEDNQVGIFKLLLHLMKLHNNRDACDTFDLSVNEAQARIECWFKRLHMKAVALILSRWKDVALFFHNHGVHKVIEAMIGEIDTELLTESILYPIFEYLMGHFEHTADSCLVIDFLKNSDEYLERAFEEVMRNKDNYTPEALLYVAEKINRNETLSTKIPHNMIFSKQVEEAIITAFKGMFLDRSTEDISSSYDWTRNGRFLHVVGITRRDVEWVFKAILEKPANFVDKCYQFETIMNQAVETFSDDLNMMVNICSQSTDSFRMHCKLLFGEHIIRKIRSRIFGKVPILRPKHFAEFSREMGYVEQYFVDYTVEGKAAFEQLLMDIKRKYKRKRKLMLTLSLND